MAQPMPPYTGPSPADSAPEPVLVGDLLVIRLNPAIFTYQCFLVEQVDLHPEGQVWLRYLGDEAHRHPPTPFTLNPSQVLAHYRPIKAL